MGLLAPLLISALAWGSSLFADLAGAAIGSVDIKSRSVRLIRISIEFLSNGFVIYISGRVLTLVSLEIGKEKMGLV